MIMIGGKRYVVPEPLGMRSFAFQQRILPVAGRIVDIFIGLLAAVPDEIKDLKKLLDIDVSTVLGMLPAAAPRIGRVFADLPQGELENLVRIMLGDPKSGAPEPATCDDVALFGPTADTFDVLMRGKTMDTWRLLWHALEVWYPDFFASARSVFAKKEKAKPSGASSTSATSGQPSV